MTNRLEGLDIVTSPTFTGTFIAATERSPYLCVEANTEEEALAEAARALEFYKTVGDRPARPSAPMQFSRFVVNKRVSSTTLVAA